MSKTREIDTSYGSFIYRAGTVDGVAVSPNFEAPIQHFMRLDKGVFIDVGAHIGRYTVQIARELDGLVMALEPHPENYALLLRNIERNKLKNVKAFPYAASDVNGSSPLWSPSKLLPYETGMHTLRYGAAGAENWKLVKTVKTVRLDDLAGELGVLEEVQLVKLDVEGFEYSVLKGMPRILREARPRIAFEGGLPPELTEFFNGFDYSVKHYPKVQMNLGEPI